MPEVQEHTLTPASNKRAPALPLVPLNYDEEEDLTPEQRQAMFGAYEESMRSIGEGEIVRGTVLAVDDKEVLVDVGFKSEGVISLSEFPDASSIKVGDILEVFLEKMENQDGLVVLSKQRADFVRVWDRVKEAHDSGKVAEGRLVRKIKGGVVVDLYGVEAFLPGSQIALRQVQNVDSLLGQGVQVKIIKLNKRRRNIVVSRRVVLEEERQRLKSEVMKELAKDQIREGVVKNITDFGAFVDLGGIDGLLHITDMSWGRVSHPSELVKIGDRIKVKVLNFDPEKERISLGLKQLESYPWEGVDEKYKVGDRIKGKVVSITDYGAFVELEKGVEGLIHVEPDPWLTLDQKYPTGMRVKGKVRNLTNFGAFVELEEGIDGLVHVSDMSWTKRVAHPSEVLKKGDTVEVVILSIDKEHRRISLGLKQVSEDPWPLLAERFPSGLELKGTINRLFDRGAIVDLGDGIEGFVPLSQLGIDDLKRPNDAFEVGEELTMKVTRVDVPNHRLILSVKAWLSEQDDIALAEWTSKRNQVRARIAVNPPAEDPAAAKVREDVGDEE